MSALSEDRNIWRRDGQMLAIPVAQGSVIYKGALVCRSGGLAVAADDEAGLSFAGVAVESVDNSGGADAAVSVRVWQSGIFPMAKESAVTADAGAEATVVDDQTVGLAATTTNDIKCGRIVRVLGSGEIEIKIDGYAY